MSRRLQTKTEQAPVITYVRGAVRPTYATDLDRYAELKSLEESLVRKFHGTGREHFTKALSLTMEHLVASSTDAIDIRLQLDSATRELFHVADNRMFIDPYFPTNDNAPLCLLPHKTLPIVLQGYIERHEDGYFKHEDVDLTYEQFQSNYFSSHSFNEHYIDNQRDQIPLTSNCRYRINVNFLHYRGEPVLSGKVGGWTGYNNKYGRDEEIKKMIDAVNTKDEAAAQKLANEEGYNEAQIRNIRTMFNDANVDPRDQAFYEWHVQRPDRLPLFLKLPPQTLENTELEMFRKLGIQFPHATTGPKFLHEIKFSIGFNAEDFTSGDSNVFFAESVQPLSLQLPMPVALVNTLPYVEDDDTQYENYLEPEPESKKDTDQKHELVRFKSMIAQQTAIMSQYKKYSADEKREFRTKWQAENGRQPTALEMAENNIVVRAALFPARFSNRVNYFDPKFAKDRTKTITVKQRSDLLLDFVCSYRSRQGTLSKQSTA